VDFEEWKTFNIADRPPISVMNAHVVVASRCRLTIGDVGLHGRPR
jgi:hypothetical protein